MRNSVAAPSGWSRPPLGPTREPPNARLAESQGEVKTAIVMLRLGVSAEGARQRLLAADGRLRIVFGEA